MKQWKCVQANSHDSVGPTIEAMEKEGWTLHTYSAAHAKVALGGVSFINHYLLFMQEKRNVQDSQSASALQTQYFKELK